MARFLDLIAAEPDIAKVPVMIDSSKWSVIEEGLKHVQGRPVVNSLSLKEGEDEFLRQARLARRYGAAVIVMAFDEQGQADTVERKVAIAHRAVELLTERGRLRPDRHHPRPEHLRHRHRASRSTPATASPTSRRSSADQAELPGVLISGGVSNVSFSFRGNDAVREAIHAVFLYHAIRAGMDMGIVNAGALPVYDDIPAELKERVEDLVLNRRADATERHARDRRGGPAAASAAAAAPRPRPVLARSCRSTSGCATRSSRASPTTSSRTPRRPGRQPRGRST